MEAEKKQKAPKKSWTKGLQAEFKKIKREAEAVLDDIN